METFYMDHSYTVKVDERFDFKLSKDTIASLDLIKTGENTFHLLKNGVSYHIKILDSDFNKGTYTISVNGNEHHASILTPLDELIEKMGFAVAGGKNVDSIAAPMPGLILDILVVEGQEVKEEDQLVILEAMKMENIITSPRDGVIKKISVSKGDAVDKKQLLIEFQ
ncbi:acetyl-CoA carboxylase biotin carboxyl carrier protein subunit [Allomuricauda sp. NBRC 101325]|uniref:acetyl-CoA carboxylase biotin carboxyl carrier protein subunit n=1 Tax=Allomuricauda sp. NBRC 101325 TaxID=1113758 RepID=UPI0024A27C82|nr:acetyl-CoA carboxylase biotin carboxyl carrier protein subunit [Muricauda sp. NBRC 101325]GLU44246.1 acetyl-CoA carboxylase biotin carboxyl carrier protein subunit [Muricauda sp. NBRC 101325]